MDELSLCEAIADSVRRDAAGRAVRSVQVRVGRLHQVEPNGVAVAWEMVTSMEPDLADSVLHLEDAPVTVECRRCGAVTTLATPIPFCSACNGLAVETKTGEELVVVSVNLAD